MNVHRPLLPLLCVLLVRAAAAQEAVPPAGDAVPASGVAAEAGAATATAAPAAAPAPAFALVHVVLHTSLGDIRLALEKERAPVTTANFLRYVDQKRFDGITFYRAMRLDEEGKYGLVQAGLQGDPRRVLPAITHEAPSKTGLSHLDGAISMANVGPGTARADFFIIIGDLVSLDGKDTKEDPGYAVFGRVVEGMDVVRAIVEQPRDPNKGEGVMKGQMLTAPVKVTSARRAD